MMSQPLLFSVIVPTRHRNDSLAACLERLAPGAQSLPADQYEVIVTDDGSQSTAGPMLREKFPWARWVAGPRQGPAANRNCGARLARGQWLAFTDDDCLPEPGWLEAYAAAIQAHRGEPVLEGSVHAGRPRRSLGEISPTKDSGSKMWSCNFAIPRSLFQSLGGFDERFPHADLEDVELSVRIRKAGHALVFVPAASVCHPWRLKGGWKGCKQNQESTLIYLSLHPELRDRINARFVFMIFLRNFFRDTLPGLFRYRGAGLSLALIEHLASLQFAFILLFKRFQPADHKEITDNAAAQKYSNPTRE